MIIVARTIQPTAKENPFNYILLTLLSNEMVRKPFMDTNTQINTRRSKVIVFKVAYGVNKLLKYLFMVQTHSGCFDYKRQIYATHGHSIQVLSRSFRQTLHENHIQAYSNVCTGTVLCLRRLRKSMLAFLCCFQHVASIKIMKKQSHIDMRSSTSSITRQ